MKINITLDNPNCLNGYLNLDPILREAGTCKIKADVTNIDEYVDIAECTELRAYNVLSFFDSNKVDKILNNWISKIRIGGTIEISEIDFEKVFKAYSRGDIDIIKFNKMLFGEQNQSWEFRKSALNMDSISEVFKNRNFEIIEKTYINFNFIVKAKRLK
jgi:hypothetical protein